MSRLVAHNVAWNVAGSMLPLLAGLIAVPLLLSGLGEARLGIFSLALGLIGLSGIFDLGLSRALTQTIAESTGKSIPQSTIAYIVRKVLGWVALLGLFWGCLLWLTAEQIVSNIFHLQAALAGETVTGLRWMALSLPVALLSTSLIGVLEGLQQFKRSNMLRAPLAMAQFLLPAIVSQWDDSVAVAIGCLAVVRIVGLLGWLISVLKIFKLFAHPPIAVFSMARLYRFTGWLTVSNIVGPLMVYADRFYLASIFPPATVAYYVVPLDSISRATTLPFAVMNALFPAFAHQGANSTETSRMLSATGLLMSCLWFPPLAIASLFALQLLGWWVGAEFAHKSFLIAQYVLLGVLVNGFAHIPFALLQSAGRADFTARLHLLELPIYVGLIISLIYMFGIVGAAMAWSARVILDAALLFTISIREFPNLKRSLLKVMSILFGTAVGLSSTFFIQNQALKYMLLVVVLSVGLLQFIRLMRIALAGVSIPLP